MSSVEHQSGEETLEDVFRLYEDEAAPVPRLSAQAAQRALKLLRDNGYIDIAGFSPRETNLTIGQVVGLRSLHDQFPDGESFRGPYYIYPDSEAAMYVPTGVSIWVHKDDAQSADQ